MSDKIYTLPSGVAFAALNAPNESIEIRKAGDDTGTVIRVSGSSTSIDSSCVRAVLDLGNRRVPIWIYHHRNKRVISWPGGTVELDVQDLAEGCGSSTGSVKPLKLTMPGKVLSVKVKEGDAVNPGQALVVVEAMKMENLLLADAKAKVAKIHVKEGDRLESGTTLITFEALSK
jgi:acetyl/propionyl-CoA carboxylase alpha subunit